jgi:hypothetical protein
MQPWVYSLIVGTLFFLMMRGGCGSHVMGHRHHHGSDDNRLIGPGGSITSIGSAQARRSGLRNDDRQEHRECERLPRHDPSFLLGLLQKPFTRLLHALVRRVNGRMYIRMAVRFWCST